jgi:RHS repeat-associated protein
VYDATGQLAAEYATGVAQDSGTTYLTADHLGSTRLVTDGGGNPVHRFDYMPFGEDLSGFGNRNLIASYNMSAVPTEKFTGKERDAESGLDYFGARYFSGAMGRFTSPDPKVMTARHLTSPQKWNKYAYVQNNPLAMVDPNGEDDYYVFRPTATSTNVHWAAIQSTATRNGDQVSIYNGGDAKAGRYTQALQTKDAHVIFAGHTVDTSSFEPVGVMLGGNVAVGDTQYNSAKNPFVATPQVLASSVAIFACNSVGLGGYSSTLFTGSAPITELSAEDAGAQSYTMTLLQGGTVQAATAGAQSAMSVSTTRTNADPTVDPKFASPTVTSTNQKGQQVSCSTQSDGTQKCTQR